MKLQAKILTLAIMAMALFTACSSDEPKEKDYKFPPLEEICGDGPWDTVEYTYYTPDNEIIDINYILQHWVGAEYGDLCFYINGDVFYNWYSCMADGNTYTHISNYRFDRMTGYIYLNNNTKPFAQVISYDAENETLVLNTDYDSIYKHTLPGHGNEEGKLIGSYAQMTLRPVTDSKMLELIYNPEITLDRREK